MIIEKMNKQEGKTTKIVEMVKKDKKGILVVPTLMAKRNICKNFKLNEKRVFIFGEIKKIKGKNVYMDDIGECLQVYLFYSNMKYATHTDY